MAAGLKVPPFVLASPDDGRDPAGCGADSPPEHKHSIYTASRR